MADVKLRATLRGSSEGLADPLVVDADDRAATLEHNGRGRAILRLAGDAQAHPLLVLPIDLARSSSGRGLEVVIDGWRFEIGVEPEQRAALRARARRAADDAGHSGPAEVHAMIPGVVVSIAVAPGDAVTAGQQLLVIEAMKMQNELRAPRAGTIGRVTVGERSKIEVGDLLVVLE